MVRLTVSVWVKIKTLICLFVQTRSCDKFYLAIFFHKVIRPHPQHADISENVLQVPSKRKVTLMQENVKLTFKCQQWLLTHELSQKKVNKLKIAED